MNRILFFIVSALWTSTFIYVVYLGYLRHSDSKLIADYSYTAEGYQQ